ncbi:hypothetical protein [Terracidiphilus gabretensis]|uniref:hypothetical protein n=1 Tax=Terracidiphilus gabretensis TaxID=1577687 RepID=UPI0018D26043|nr:hypothetical protein [Terracidiphilus gabretensis]
MAIKRKNEITPDELAIERIEECICTLNDGPKTPQLERVERVITLLGKLTGDASDREKLRVFTELLHVLGQYKWSSYIAPYGDGWTVVNNIADHTHLTKADLWEHEAVRDLLAAFPRLGVGERPFIRRCESPKCQRWFIAPRKDKGACSDACKQWLYDNRSPEQRASKALYMKNLRRGAKALRERQDERTGFTKGKRRVVSRKYR